MIAPALFMLVSMIPVAVSPSPSPSPASEASAFDRKLEADSRVARAATTKRLKALFAEATALNRTQRKHELRERIATQWRTFADEGERLNRWRFAEYAYYQADKIDYQAHREEAEAIDVQFRGRVKTALHSYVLAVRYYRYALARLESTGNRESPIANDCRRRLAKLDLIFGDWPKARALIAEAEEIDRKHRPWDVSARSLDEFAAGDLALDEQRYAEALADFERGEKLTNGFSTARSVAFSPDGAEGMTRALIGLDSDWATLTVIELSDELLIANEDLVAILNKSMEYRHFDALTAAKLQAGPAADVGIPETLRQDLKDARRSAGAMSAFDDYARQPGIDTARAYRAIGDAHAGLGNEAAAQAAYQHARLTYTRALGGSGPDLGEYDGLLGAVALARGMPHEAIRLLRRAIAEDSAFDLGDSPLAVQQTGLLARALDGDGRVAEAGATFERSLRMVRRVLAGQSFLTDRQRLAFLKEARGTFDAYAAFLIARRPSDSGRNLFDLALFGKELAAGSLSSVYAASASDPTLAPLRARLAAERELVTRGAYGPGGFSSAVYEADLAEADLVAAATSRGDARPVPIVTWRDVRAALRPGEAAVEYLRIGTTYVALVLRPDSIEPALVPIGSDDALAQTVATYASAVTPDGTGDLASSRGLYRLVWAPLVAPLAGAHRVFLSTDGTLDQISFDTLQREDGKELIDLVDIRQMTSTKDLLAKHAAPASNVAAIFADPSFDAEIARNEALPEPGPIAAILAEATPAPQLVASLPLDETRIAVRGGSLRPLPETEDELRSIAATLHARGWTVDAYRGVDATKPAFESLVHPRVLHVATHGYVLRDVPSSDPRRPNSFQDPMQRTMLFFAGAGRTWSKTEPPSSALDDGILTAREASALDLHGTELVVLSACETGLGRIESGEDVLGLRRGFQEAGAQFVLSTLWEIPSDSTVTLLSRFYQNWLGGQDKYAALREAQQFVRADIIARTGRDDPRAWGGFILVGDGRG